MLFNLDLASGVIHSAQSTTNLTSAFELVLFTCCPPGPEDLVKEILSWFLGTSTLKALKSLSIIFINSMELESVLFNSEGSCSKDSLLRKCRDTIHQLQSDLDSAQRTSEDLETRLKGSIEAQLAYQKEVHEKSYQIKVLTSENTELCSKYEVFIEKALVVQQDNETLHYELEITKSRYRECENSLSKTIDLLEHSKIEVKTKSEMIKEWSDTMSEVESQMNYLADENGYLKQEIEKSKLKERELERRVKSTEDEKCVIFKSVQEFKEKLAVCKFDLESKGRALAETQNSLDEVKNRSVALEISLSEVSARAKIAQEENKTNKVKVDHLERQLKEMGLKNLNELEKLNKTLENKTSFFGKEDSRKLGLINRLETDLKSVKDELENLILADSQLQGRYREILAKLAKKKAKIEQIKVENGKLNQSLMRFEEKLKSIEAGYLSEANFFKQENASLAEKLKKNEKVYCEKLNQTTLELNKKAELASEENSRLKQDLSKYSNELGKLLSHKEDELSLLNEDRQKLQQALSELESKVVSMSLNLESSVSDCWRLSSELSRHNDIKKDELAKLGEYYKVKLYHKDEEFQVQNEKYTERLKSKITSIYEKASVFKETLRKELENLETVLKNIEPCCDFNISLSRIHSLLNSFII